MLRAASSLIYAASGKEIEIHNRYKPKATARDIREPARGPVVLEWPPCTPCTRAPVAGIRYRYKACAPDDARTSDSAPDASLLPNGKPWRAWGGNCSNVMALSWSSHFAPVLRLNSRLGSWCDYLDHRGPVIGLVCCEASRLVCGSLVAVDNLTANAWDLCCKMIKQEGGELVDWPTAPRSISGVDPAA